MKHLSLLRGSQAKKHNILIEKGRTNKELFGTLADCTGGVNCSALEQRSQMKSDNNKISPRFCYFFTKQD